MRSLAFLMLFLLAATANAKRGRGRAKPKVKPAQTQSQAKTPEAKKASNVAVLDLGGLGISRDLLENLQLLLRNSISTIDGVNLVSPVDLEIALRNPKHKAAAECGGGPSCSVAKGKAAGADIVVFGTIGAIGSDFNLNLRAMDTHAGKEVARQRTSISGNRDMLIPELRIAAFKLIAPDRIRGSLLIEIDVEGVQIEIDGEKVGTTPLSKPVGNLTPGQHVVVLRREGYSELQKEFTIKAFQTARLKVDLKSSGAP